MKTILKKLSSLLTGLALTAAMLPTMPMQASAASDYWKFDFGAGGTEGGYTGVSASTKYNSGTGYGFSYDCNVSDVSASGWGALSDAVQFKNSTNTGSASFCADVPNGLYQVSVWLGNTNRTSVAAEGMYQLINLMGDNAYDTFQIPVKDGQLNICCCAGKEGYAYTLSALEIKKISDNPVTNPTVWICGDSTVCNYYPLDSSSQAGWGQMLPSVIDTNKWQVRNLAASGQYAKGFVDAGQFTPIETFGHEGDIYFISIGINDTNYSNESEYTQVVTDMAKRAMAKGMRVILVKQQGRNGDCQRNPLLTGRWFGGALDSIGKSLNIEVLDLFTLWQNHCMSIGADATTNLYVSGDGLHPNRAGATVLAKLVAENIDFSAGGNPSSGTQTTEPQQPEAVYKKGDVNNDGVITVSDLTLAKRGLLGSFSDNAARKAADLNDDSSVSMADLVLFVQYLTAQISKFPVQERYYAINASFSEGIKETVNAGFVGEAYLNLDNTSTSNVTFTVNVEQDGNYYMAIRNANGSANNRQMMLSVGGDSRQWLQDFQSTGAWTTWEMRGLVLPLKAGQNSIKFQSYTSEGGPNLDYITLSLTDEPIAEVYDPNASGQHTNYSSNPVIYIAGDSTAQSYNASYAPQQGWGYYLGDYFNSSVTVSNHSLAGRSSKQFYDNGRLQTILDQMKSGDYLVVCFGINDGAYNKEERYAPCCGFVDNPTYGSFEYYMEFYIEGALAKGGTPVLMSPTLSIKNAQQPFSAGYRNIDTACKQLANKYKVPYFDLGSAMANNFNNIAYNTVYGYYLGSTTNGGTDFTHFTETGAKVVAKIVSDGLKGLNIGL